MLPRHHSEKYIRDDTNSSLIRAESKVSSSQAVGLAPSDSLAEWVVRRHLLFFFGGRVTKLSNLCCFSRLFGSVVILDEVNRKEELC